MQVLYESCCGLDVHARTVVACLIKKGRKEIRTFSTMTEDLIELLDWLSGAGSTHVAMESTGVYWKPVFNILEGAMEVLLVNARHVKAVPGRKTDVKDCEWLADLLRHGLLRGSFIPPFEIRELRELVRYRSTLVQERSATANRIQKVCESANIKLSQVAADALGQSGLAMLRALAEGEEDAGCLVELARGKLKQKKPELRRALQSRMSAAQRWVLRELLARYDELEAAVERVNGRLREELEKGAEPLAKEAVALLDSIPGVGIEVAQVMVAEIGVRMEQFPTARHLASWAGMCPGNHESAGKRQSGKRRHGNKHLRAALVQAAWGAARTKGTYMAAQYRRLVKRRGKKRALIAVGHSILVMAYQMLKNKVGYQELGGDYFERQQKQRQSLRLVNQLEALGFKVTIEELSQAA